MQCARLVMENSIRPPLAEQHQRLMKPSPDSPGFKLRGKQPNRGTSMRNRIFSRPLCRHAFAACALFAAASFTSIAMAQSEPSTASSSRTTQIALPQVEAALDLPDAPGISNSKNLLRSEEHT